MRVGVVKLDIVGDVVVFGKVGRCPHVLQYVDGASQNPAANRQTKTSD